jgi:hypothetical protein
MTTWTAITDSLPEPGPVGWGWAQLSRNVIVVDKHGHVFTAYYLHCDKEDADGEKTLWRVVGSNCYEAYYITHWQPLPAPPTD